MTAGIRGIIPKWPHGSAIFRLIQPDINKYTIVSIVTIHPDIFINTIQLFSSNHPQWLDIGIEERPVTSKKIER